MSEDFRPFSAHYISALTPDRIYRVYPTCDEIFFIRVGGSRFLRRRVLMGFAGWRGSY